MGLFGAKTQTAEAPVIESARPLESLRAAAEALLGAGKVAGDQAPILADLILEAAVQQGASDVHLETHGDKLRVRFRIDGILQDILSLPNPRELYVVQRLRVLANFDPEPPAQYRPEDGRFQKQYAGRLVQFRVSSFPSLDGETMVVRVLDSEKVRLKMDQLGVQPNLLDRIRKIVRSPYGIFFVTGPTGSGKTTTLYSILETLNQPASKIVTLEDPVEYRIEGVNHAQVNPKSGFTFAEGLKGLLRQDPNVIMVGEMRDQETAETAMRFSLTGHLVLSTLHTVGAPGAVERLIEMGVPPFLVVSSSLGVLSQRLVRRLCAACAQPSQPPHPNVITELVRTMSEAEGGLIKYAVSAGKDYKTSKGCPQCRSTGYKGRLGVFEYMEFSEVLRQLILSKASLSDLRREAVKGGMTTLLADGLLKAAAGVTSVEEVLKVTIGL